MSSPLFDRVALRRRRARAARAGDPLDVLHRRAAEDLADRLATTLRRFETAVDIGSDGPWAVDVLRAAPNVGRVLRLDRVPGPGVDVVAELDLSPLAPASVDLVVSLLTLQTTDDLPGTLIQIRRALKPDGLFLAAMVGGHSLRELREAFTRAEAEVEGGVSPRVAPFADVRDMGGLLQRAGFALPVTDVDGFVVRHADAADLFRDLRALGATNPLAARRRTPLKRATFARALEALEAFRDADGRLVTTVEIMWLSGWAPHESQPKPLRPGSARISLADVLGKTSD